MNLTTKLYYKTSAECRNITSVGVMKSATRLTQVTYFYSEIQDSPGTWAAYMNGDCPWLPVAENRRPEAADNTRIVRKRQVTALTSTRQRNACMHLHTPSRKCAKLTVKLL